MPKVINLLSGPRNISTALMYAFAQHPEVQVLDEPFYGFYLSNSKLLVAHPSHKEIIKSQPIEESKVVQQIERLAEERTVFVKGMAHHMINNDPRFLLQWSNIILIRHPQRLIHSFAKVIPNPSLSDIGLQKAWDLFQYLTANGSSPLVIDSDELVKNPKRYLQQICTYLNIPFTEHMLSWEKGGRPEDGVWAKHWYHAVHKSSCFRTEITPMPTIPFHLNPLLKKALPYYEKLFNNVLKNDAHVTEI